MPSFNYGQSWFAIILGYLKQFSKLGIYKSNFSTWVDNVPLNTTILWTEIANQI